MIASNPEASGNASTSRPETVTDYGIPDKANSVSHSTTYTVAGFSIRDTASAIDQLGFTPYVEAVAAYLTNEGTVPPLTMSIEGEWGSGKSSFMLMLEAAIENHYKQSGRQAKIVRFNAWRYDKDEALWAAFALLLTNSLAKQLRFRKRMQAHCFLQYQRFNWKKGWFAVVRFVVLALFLLFTTIAFGKHLFRYPNSINPFFAKNSVSSRSMPSTAPGPTGEGKPDVDLLRLLMTGAGGAGYLLLLAMLVKKVIDTVGNPFAIDLTKFSGALNYEERISFIEQFHADFAKILGVYAEGQTVFVFIDDLDRCELPKAADMMQGINLLMSDSCKAIYILGLDRDKIAAGLAAKYEKLFTYLNDQRSPGSSNTATQSGLDFGFDFLEKFIQIPYQIPRPSNADITRLFAASSGQSAEAPSTENVDPAILFETKIDSPLVRQIISMVAPSFNHNPRRMKQFVNCFRLGAITASRTGLFGMARSTQYSPLTVEQLGKMVAICLRWPLLIGDAMQNLSLLRVLEVEVIKPGTAPGMPDSTKRIVDYWLAKDKLVALLRYGLTGPDGSNYSLGTLDLERYLQISPALSPRQNNIPVPGRAKSRDWRPDLNADEEGSVAPMVTTEAENPKPDVSTKKATRSSAPSDVTQSSSEDWQSPDKRGFDGGERRSD